MKNEDIPTDEDSYWEAFDLFGSEYVCRLLGVPLYDDLPEDLACLTCSKEMKYVATITQDIEERGLISVVDFPVWGNEYILLFMYRLFNYKN